MFLITEIANADTLKMTRILFKLSPTQIKKLLHKIDNRTNTIRRVKAKKQIYPITIKETPLLYDVQHVVTLNILHISPNLSSYLCFSSETLIGGFLQRNISTDGQEAFYNPFLLSSSATTNECTSRLSAPWNTICRMSMFGRIEVTHVDRHSSRPMQYLVLSVSQLGDTQKALIQCLYFNLYYQSPKNGGTWGRYFLSSSLSPSFLFSLAVFSSSLFSSSLDSRVKNVASTLITLFQNHNRYQEFTFSHHCLLSSGQAIQNLLSMSRKPAKKEFC